MLQNRVDPFGNIIKTPARGHLMGNRGLLHGDHKNILRPFRLKAWITCVLEFKNRKREVMTPRLYTELFFYDEATSFAAGHRPCFECRRKDADLFKASWLKGNPVHGFDLKTPIGKIDEIIHEERLDKQGRKRTYDMAVESLPDGVFVLWNDAPFLRVNKMLYEWTPFGYKPGIVSPADAMLPVLTPGSIVNAFRAGYVPQMQF